jgi:RNA polymerase sigma-70 factor (ECF subfamily)
VRGTIVPRKEEHELVLRAIEGNERAFREIVERHQSVVYSVILGIVGDHDDADDIAQDIFIKVYRGLPGYRGDSKLSTWIYRIARNTALNYASKRTYDHRPIDEAHSLASSWDTPEERLSRNVDRVRIRRHLSHLEERYRTAIELRYMGEKSYEEIAGIMEIPVGTVKTYIHRAKASLKTLMETESAPAQRKEQQQDELHGS